jgi:hypothetical protein
MNGLETPIVNFLAAGASVTAGAAVTAGASVAWAGVGVAGDPQAASMEMMLIETINNNATFFIFLDMVFFSLLDRLRLKFETGQGLFGRANLL